MAIPTPIVRNLEESGTIRTMAIDLSEDVEDRAAIIEVLRSKLYSDKILAPIREYATNAFDSHVEAGRPHVPIRITLPTQISPEFRVRDFGIGLNPDEIEKIYIKYGRSTKRNTNSQTGQLGLGCKSGFAYGDNFIIGSYKEGVKTTYNLTISGVCTIVVAEPMEADDQNGIEVIIPVDPNDIVDFQNKSMNFFKYWKICPELHGGEQHRIEELRAELANKPLFADDFWEIRPVGRYDRYSENRGIAVMGNVPYPLNWDIISQKLNATKDENDPKDTQRILFDFIRSNSTILRFDIGDLDFSASRESLEYTEKTCRVVLAKIQLILDSIFRILDTKIKSAKTFWDAMVIYNQIFGQDHNRMFEGEIYRLESYYKGKFSWNGIEIESGAFEHLERWDQVLGFAEDAKWKVPGTVVSGTTLTVKPADISGQDCVLTTFMNNHSGRIKEVSVNSWSNNRIVASSKKDFVIMIHDLDKPVLTKSSVRYIIENTADTKTVYFLRFKDDAQKKHFFKKLNFDSAPVVYVSTIQDKVKAWIKAKRISGGGTPKLSDFQPTRFFTVESRKNSYGGLSYTNWDKETIDIHETDGYYLEVNNDEIKVNGNNLYDMGYIAHHTKVLCDAIGIKVLKVYGLTERTRNAKWFDVAVTDGQWIKLDKHFLDNVVTILSNNTSSIAKSNNYFSSMSGSGISIDFAIRLLPKLTNTNSPMYKICSEISEDFNKFVQLREALAFFNLAKTELKGDTTDFGGMFTTMHETYPLITSLSEWSTIKSNNSQINFRSLQKIADYVNMVDSVTVAK